MHISKLAYSDIVDRAFKWLAVLTLCLLIGGGNTSAQTLEGITYAAALSPDGSLVAASDHTQDFEEIIILDQNLQFVRSLGLDLPPLAADGWPYRSATLKQGPIRWSPDGTMVAAPFELWSGDYPTFETIVWNVQTGDVVLRWTGSWGRISWSPSGQYLAVDNVIVDVFTGNPFNAFDSIGDPYWVVWNPGNEDQLLLGFYTEALIINPFTAEEIARIPYMNTEEHPPSFNTDGSQLAVFTGFEPVRFTIFETTTYQEIEVIRYPENTTLAGYRLVGMNFFDRGTIGRIEGHRIPQTNIRNLNSGSEITINERILSWDREGRTFLSYRYFDPQRQCCILNVVSLMTFNGNTATPFSLLAQVSSVPTIRTLSVGGVPLRGGPLNVIDERALANRTLTAVPDADNIGSVQFTVNGVPQEPINAAPYTIELPDNGRYTVTAIPYSGSNATGDAGLSFSAELEIASGGIRDRGIRLRMISLNDA